MASQGQRLKVLVSGASGMVGRALTDSLSTPSAINFFRSDSVYHLVRRQPRHDREIFWDPMEGRIDLQKCEGFDAVVHLAGENIGSGEGFLAFTGRWTERKKYNIMESRRRGTHLLATALSSLRQKPGVFISASGIGYYGAANGDRILTESSPQGNDFLADVANVWEQKTAPASAASIRTVNMRFGVVLSRSGGVLEKLYWPFYMGLGGQIGSGDQYMSWIGIQDLTRAIEHAINRSEVSGAVNVCSPNPVTNAEFTRALAGNLHRPAFFPMPEAMVRSVFGEMGEQTLLASQRASPDKLMSTGFRFLYPSIDQAIAAALNQ